MSPSRELDAHVGTLGRLLRQLSPRTADFVAHTYNELAHRRYRGASMSSVFDDIYQKNHWRSAESVSGPGSSLEQTARLREWLPKLLSSLGARSLLDVPCGDFGWMSTLDLKLDEYIGGDIVAPLVEQNRARYGTDGRRFLQLDVTASQLPRVDVVLCRDCLVHLDFDAGLAALRNIARSGSRWLLTTTFVRHGNRNITTGNWRPINLALPPYDLPEPLLTLNEGCTEGGAANSDKSLALYEIAALPVR